MTSPSPTASTERDSQAADARPSAESPLAANARRDSAEAKRLERSSVDPLRGTDRYRLTRPLLGARPLSR